MQEESEKKLEIFSERLRGSRSSAGLTQSELAARVGATLSAVGNWESGLNLPKGERLRKTAETLGVSIAYLLGETEDKGSAPPRRSSQEIALREGASTYKPDDIEGMRYVQAMDPEVFVLQMFGDSMAPEIKAGDELLVSPNSTLESGDVVFAKKINGEIAVRLYFEQPNGKCLLTAINPVYPSMEYERGDFKIIAAVWQLTRRLKVRGEFKPGSKD